MRQMLDNEVQAFCFTVVERAEIKEQSARSKFNDTADRAAISTGIASNGKENADADKTAAITAAGRGCKANVEAKFKSPVLRQNRPQGTVHITLQGTEVETDVRVRIRASFHKTSSATLWHCSTQ